jgi:hypothetical protein
MKFIVTTTINSPTKALLEFSKLQDWHLIIAGDKKTPHAAYDNLHNVTYLSPEQQDSKYPQLSKALGWNCIQRRNIAILEAINRDATVIAIIDDDNIPTKEWGKNIHVGLSTDIIEYSDEKNPLVMDPVIYAGYSKLWHRGFPLQELSSRNAKTIKQLKTRNFDIQANFWNGDPDIDAICRMEHRPECYFNPQRFPFCLGSKFSPFNSQNTILTKQAAKEYFLFPGIGRMDDIWASYWLEAKGFKVVYAEATVTQIRNEHDLTKDFSDEILGNLKTCQLISDLSISPEFIYSYLPNNSKELFELYKEEQL